MKKISLLLILVSLTSCGIIVNYDYETTTDFSKYKTYNYFDDMKTGLSPFDTKRLTRAIDEKLASMGLQKTDNADFYIDIQSQDIQNRNNSNVGVGVGGGGGNIGGGVSVGIPIGQPKNTREIVIDFVTLPNEKTFWQAVSESTYSDNATPEKRENLFNNLVEKIFSKYPPEK